MKRELLLLAAGIGLGSFLHIAPADSATVKSIPVVLNCSSGIFYDAGIVGTNDVNQTFDLAFPHLPMPNQSGPSAKLYCEMELP